MKDMEYTNRIIQEVGKVWAIARSLENELVQVEPKDGESADSLDAAMSLSYLMTDTLEVLRKFCYEA